MKRKGASLDKIILNMLRSSVCKVRVTEVTQTGRHRLTDTDRQTQTHRQIGTDRQTQTDRQIVRHRPTDRQPDRPTGTD